ncbi:MAG TPA: hypothetical protein VHI13_14820 [Candidatus Kapabacteria bacterium]|nr:hypothetical protein [Candidatus Kapabacteria bacterium]
MSTRLVIGVAVLRPGMRMLLDQLGVAYEGIVRWDELDPARYSAVIVNRSPDAGQLAALREYLRGGGAVLDAGYLLRAISRRGFAQRRVRWFLPDADDPMFGTIGLADLHQTIWCHPDASYCDGLVHLTAADGGHVAYLPFDLHRAVVNHRSVRRTFHSPWSRDPDEIVGRISKGGIRRVVEGALIWLHQQRGLPYLHRWYFPEDARSVFCYRIDSDYGTRAQVLALHEHAARHGIPLTWFLHVAAHQEWLSLFNEFEGDETALHCYRHRTFNGGEENAANIALGLAMMKDCGMQVEGFAAPNGFWNHALAAAVAAAGLLYSSEFSLAYDDVPFRPWSRGDLLPTLQVPVHPVCIGSLKRVKAPQEAMARYFRRAVDHAMAGNLPALLYHHPGHEGWDVVEDTFLHVRARGIPAITMGDYARWWTRRNSMRHAAETADGRIAIRYTRPDPAVLLAARTPDGRVAFVRGESVALDGLQWREPHPADPDGPEGIKRIRRFSLDRVRHSIEDYNARARQ